MLVIEHNTLWYKRKDNVSVHVRLYIKHKIRLFLRRAWNYIRLPMLHRKIEKAKKRLASLENFE